MLKVFMNAAAFSQLDKLNGVTENVMLGQLGRFGSGFVDLLLDDSKLAASMDLLGLTQSIGYLHFNISVTNDNFPLFFHRNRNDNVVQDDEMEVINRGGNSS